ncbi:MAG TPA: DUF5777 family beta-barrel protein [Terriglobia bacterium]|nr:DUF5777 family beta-barrel protein [Terriglobia bacterium]
MEPRRALLRIVVFTLGFVSILAFASAEAFSSPPAEGARAVSGASLTGNPGPGPAPLANTLGISFVEGSTSTVVVERDGKKYLVDLVSRSIRETNSPSPAANSSPAHTAPASAFATAQASGGDVFRSRCSQCHGVDGRGVKGIGTPDFTDGKLQASLTDDQIIETIRHGKQGTMMPAWTGKLSDQEISAVGQYVRSFGSAGGGGGGQASEKKPGVYEAGDDSLMSLPTGRRLARHGFYVNFAHRFPYDPAFSGTARGGTLLGLDGFAVPSFGFRYGVTDKFSVSIWRSPSIIGRPIQLMAAYNLLDEHDGSPFNMAMRVSLEGQNDLQKNFTENFEEIISRSLTSHAQIYFVPTISFNDRPLAQTFGNEASDIPDFPGTTAVSLGTGLSVDIRPTVALVAEVIPTVIGGRELGIHRPAYSFGIQKKIWRHSFTFGFTTSPGTTVSQRAGTRASFLGDPTADKPSGLVIGFDLTRQIY